MDAGYWKTSVSVRLYMQTMAHLPQGARGRRKLIQWRSSEGVRLFALNPFETYVCYEIRLTDSHALVPKIASHLGIFGRILLGTLTVATGFSSDSIFDRGTAETLPTSRALHRR
jgi:hypothetical protein